MTKLRINIFVVVTIIGIILVAAWIWRPEPNSVTQKSISDIPTTNTTGTPAISSPMTLPSGSVPDPGGPLSIKTMSREDATKLYVQRFNSDHQYDWKVPLNFYGKVVDENNRPVEGAKVHFQWNTLWTASSDGTADEETSSDRAGLFSLTGKRGKVLEVRVQKEGYYTVGSGTGDMSFEYANPSLKWWYEPDSNNPVLFHLLKKGEGAKLFSKSLSVPLNNAHPQVRINLMQGLVTPDGVLTITSDESKFLPGNQPFPWTFSLSMSEGGMVETNDQFPFMAPSSGYRSAINVDMTNTEPSVWQDGVKKTYYFYLPSSNTYGRMSVSKIVGLPVVSLDYAYNLTPGNRVLESATNK